MAYIKIDTDAMQTVINNINDYANAADGARRAIRRSSEYHYDPVESVVTDTEPLPDLLNPAPGNTTISANVARLREVAYQLRSRRQEAIDINESGITMTNPDGTLSYYLPDPPPGTTDEAAYWRNMDTADNVHAYNTGAAEAAKADAAALDQALGSLDGTAKDGRTVEQILNEAAKHRDIPAYGASFTDQYTAEEYLQLVYALDGHYQISYDGDDGGEQFSKSVETLSHILAAASQDQVGGADLAAGFTDAVNPDISQRQLESPMTALNALLSVPDTAYGTGFLGALAENLEDIDPTSVPASGPPPFANGEFYTADPLAGVLTAMGSNSEAALKYLTSDGTNDADIEKRWEMLRQRDWDYHGGAGLDGLSAATAAASAYRGADGDPNAPADAAARATWMTAQAIPFFVDHVEEVDFTATMKQNLAVLLGNSPEELAALADSSSLESDDAYGLSGLVTDAEFETLLYRVIDDENAAGTLAAAMGQYHHNQIDSKMPAASNPEETLLGEYQNAATTMGYLDGIAELRAGDDSAAQADAKSNMGTAVSVFSTALGTGVSAVTGGTGMAVAGPLLYSSGSTIAKPVIIDQLTEDWNTPDTINVADIKTVLRAQAYVDAAQYGLLSDAAMEAAATGNNGSPFSFYTEIDGQPTITAPNPITPETAHEYITWQRQVNDPTMNSIDNEMNSTSLGHDEGLQAEIIK
ncbi:DUF6571 family protein [Actinomyces glycerinitolerans]|uniref:DUF6571 domain-containing protein n=1 Tax=Actinomyces glycerinitolerans TaxID=1892869 RepID=A0A1M4RWY8_9ACTO|nr:DUF6571 family protein [Actinomyces glycerinitolerans]SHE24486.1 Hypothetical protein ACGLYG10_0690 [Actinomyces glycerinitolerans]